MPKTTKSGKPKSSELPSTLKKSDKKAQRTFTKTYDSAIKEYGDEKRAHQVAFAAVKHTHEKIGDHWEPKSGGKKGPSDARAAERARTSRKKTAEGVDANASKTHLLDVAKRLDVKGRSKMKKSDLVDAIKKANRRESAKNRAKKK